MLTVYPAEPRWCGDHPAEASLSRPPYMLHYRPEDLAATVLDWLTSAVGQAARRR